MSNYTRKEGWVRTYDKTGAATWTKKQTFKRNPDRPLHALDGKAQPAMELSASAQKALPYATGLLAQSRKDVKDDLADHTFRNLAVGTEAMDYTKGKLIKGRGNVDANDPKFPEAHYRTKVGYATKTQGFTEFAAKAELLRAGNCDMHAASTYTYAGAHMGEDSVAAKVVHPGHTFSELRGKDGATKVSDKDVIVDSWAGGSHAVLREDSYFATAISASRDRTTHPDHTQATTDLAAGKLAFKRKETIVSSNQAFAQHHDAQAALTQNRVQASKPITRGMWSETPIMSDEGKLETSKRGYTFRTGSKQQQDMQTVFVARKMGASIAGATKLTRK